MMRMVLIYNNNDFPKGKVTSVRTYPAGHREVSTFPEGNFLPFVFGVCQDEPVELQTTWISSVDGDDVFDADKRTTGDDSYLESLGRTVIA